MINTRPMPSPNGTNREGLTLPASRVSLAQDAALHASDCVDGITNDGKGNEVVRRYRERQELLKRFPNWDRLANAR